MRAIFSRAGKAIREFFIKLFTTRTLILAVILFALLCIIIGRLFYLQVVKSDYYSENFTQKTEKTITYEGARGNIYDCNGVLLAHNEAAYSVYMTDLIESSDKKGEIINDIIYQTILILEKNGDKLNSDFNIEIDSNGNIEYKSEPRTKKITFLCNVYGLTSDEIYDKGYYSLSAEEVLDYMCSENRFDISDEYSDAYKVKICNVRYQLSLNSYKKYVATEIATDVSQETRAAISENKATLEGVEIREYYKRVYDGDESIAPIVGYTGKISESELKNYNESNETNFVYELSDYVGKAGVEKSYDAWLQGTKGEDVVYVDAKGNIMSTISSTKSGSGNDLYLSIDSELQKGAYALLEQEIAGILASKLVNWDYEPNDTDNVILIPIKDVYYKLLTNVIDTSKFSEEDASDIEKETLATFNARVDEIIAYIDEYLNDPQAAAVKDIPEEYNEYMYYIYDYLDEIGILDKELMDQTSKVYTDWVSEDISLREFIFGAISENWINANSLGYDSKLTDSTQIFNSIVTRVVNEIRGEKKFAKKVYYYMIYNETLSGRDVCLMLYDQGILDKEDNYYTWLLNYEIEPFGFVYNKIINLEITPAMIALDPCSGSIVVTESKTGKVKALVTYPSYDNNKLSGTIDYDYWTKLTNDDSSPMFNRATQALTAPGSTFKPLTAVTALSEGLIDPDTYIYDEGIFTEVVPSPRCWVYPGTHEYVNVESSLSVSCNYFYYTLGYNLGFEDENDTTYSSGLGLEKIEKYAIQIGLAIKSGVEIEEVEPRFSTTDSVRTAIGQGTNGFTTSQLARYVNTVTQRGNNIQLSVIDRVESKTGEVLKKVDTVVSNVLEMPDSYWNAIYAGMIDVTTIGLAQNIFADSNVAIAGKTGTAQENIYRSNHATFIGFAPYNDPEVSFASIIRNADASTYPAEYCKDVMNFYYGHITLDEILSRGAKEISSEVISD